MIVKSITLLRPYIITTFMSFLIAFIISTNGTVVDEESKRKIINDLPTKNDFDLYLVPLEKIVYFGIKHKIYLDVNFEFGFFLATVNLRKTLEDKRQSLPSNIRSRLEQLLMKTDILAEFFRRMVKKTENVIAYARDRKISTLFANDTDWPITTKKFNVDLLDQTNLYTGNQLEKIYGKWDSYKSKVYDFDSYIPSPHDSDICMAYLATNPTNRDNLKSTNCQILPQCKLAVNNGSDFGYGLAHRTLFLILAHHARGCFIFSEQEDKYKVDKYCMKTFNEAQFIALNYYELSDLMMEQISICTLTGHAQFLRRSWLSRLLEFQTYEGCFSDNIVTGNDHEDPMYEDKNEKWTIASHPSIMGKRCNSHATAVAASTLASTLRYIMENYYSNSSKRVFYVN